MTEDREDRMTWEDEFMLVSSGMFTSEIHEQQIIDFIDKTLNEQCDVCKLYDVNRIKEFIDDLTYALTHTEFCNCKICKVIKQMREEIEK